MSGHNGKAPYADVPFISRARHYERVNELLESNNAYLERARAAERAMEAADQNLAELIDQIAAEQIRRYDLEDALVVAQERMADYLEEDNAKSWWQRFKERHFGTTDSIRSTAP